VSFEQPVDVDGTVRANTADSTRDVVLALEWHAASSVAAPEWSGLVQSVQVTPGAPLNSGDVFARVGGVDRVACATTYPMEGPVEVGARGQDVSTLQECLESAGYDVAADKGSYGQATRDAVAALTAKTGADSGKGQVFDAAWLVFLPEDGYLQQTVDLLVGAPAPQAGSVIATSAAELTRAALTDAAYADNALIYAPAEGEEASASGMPEAEPLTAGTDDVLRLAGTEIALDDARDQVAEEALPKLRSLVEIGAVAVEAVLARPPGAGELVIPAAAVVAAENGTVCVLRVEDGLEPVRVEVLGDVDGGAVVRAELKVGDKVRVDPAPEDRRCG
jgi:peptidoglycan hydrolase-like protein with peptidoglycan-binding domain